MSDAAPLPPPPGNCPSHPQLPAHIACLRCGTLVCERCVATSPADEPICPACTAAHGYRAVRREGAEIDPSACLQRAWNVFRMHWAVVVLATLLLVGLQFLAALPAGAIQVIRSEGSLSESARGALALLWIPLEVAAYYVNFSLQAGLLIVWLRLLRGQPSEASHLFHGFRYGHRALLALIPFALAVAVGLLALVVGAVIAVVALSLYMPLIVDKGMGPIESLRTSWMLTRGQRLPLLVVLLLGVPILLAGLLACCVGVIPAYGLGIGLQMAAYDSLVWPGGHYLKD